MPTTIKLKNSVTTTSVPSSLVQGEVAINITDKKVWVGNAATTPIQIAGAGTTGNAAGSNTQVQYNSSGSFAGSANFTFNGTTVTMANDASISGLTVGKGGGAVSTNTAIGTNAISSNTSGARNTSVGTFSSSTNTTSGDNTGIGYAALNQNTGASNTAVGSQASQLNTSGANNTSLGYAALYSNTTASNNTAVGYQAGYAVTTGTPNCFFGYQAGNTITTATYNNFFGYQAGQGASGNEKNGFGSGALQIATGSGNNAFGSYAGSAITSGTYNACFGHAAGASMTTGSKNTILGSYSGNQGGLDIRTSSNYIVLSDGDGNPRAYWDSFGILRTTSTQTNNDACVVRNTAASPYGVDVVFNVTPNNTTNYFYSAEDNTNQKAVIYSSGTMSNRTGTYNTISDIKIKQDVKDASSQWDDIKAIRFKKYRLIDDVKENPNAPYLMGVVAQELRLTSPNLVDECVGKDGEITLGVKQSIIFMKAAKALQEAMERIETLEAKVQQLENK